MFVFHLNSRRNIFKHVLSIISFILFRWQQRIHFYIFFISLFLTCFISYRQPFSLLFQQRSIDSVRNSLINQQKQEQKDAYEWMEGVWKNSQNFPNLISNQTQQSKFYDHAQIKDRFFSSHKLFTKQSSILSNKDDHIIISILYSKQDSDYREGKFYIGQILYHLLKNHHSRFIITLCEHNNTNDETSAGIELIRRILPVFMINTQSESSINRYEREKQAHVECILANFQSFSHANYLLLLQDDAEPVSKSFYNQLISLIDHRIQQQWPINGHRKQPGFMKIYHPRWLISYLHPSVYLIVQLLSTSLFLTLFFFFSYYLYQRLIQKSSNIHQQPFQYYSGSLLTNYMYLSSLIINNRKILYFIFYFLLITCILILLDHSNVSWTWRSLHPSLYAIYPAPSCCLPGVMYFRQTYIQVTDYLNSIACHHNYAIDTALDALPKRTQLQTFLVEPNLVHHIGLYSRLRKMYINPYLLD